MRLARSANKMMKEPPAVLLTDLAFNLLIFFVVCASTEPETGRKQSVPSGSKEKQAAAQGEQNVEVSLTREAAMINGDPVRLSEVTSKMKQLLTGKTKPEQRMVVVKTTKDTPYHHWIRVTGMIEDAGGVIAVVVEETKTVVTP